MTNSATPPGEIWPAPGARPNHTLRRLAAVAPESLHVDTTSEAATAAEREANMRTLYERRHADMVRFAAFLTGDPSQADDIAQDAFVRVFDAWDRVEDSDKLDAYLKATVVNLVRGRHRRNEVAKRRGAPHLTVVASAEETAMGSVGREQVLAAVATLPIRQRACVVMRHWMRMTETEIADTLDLSVGSVRTHIKRGTKSLQERLGDAR